MGIGLSEAADRAGVAANGPRFACLDLLGYSSQAQKYGEKQPVRTPGELLFNLLLLVIFAAAFALALAWPATARRYPLLISGAGICASGWLLAAGFRDRGMPRQKKRFPSAESVRELLPTGNDLPTHPNDIRMIMWYIAFGAAVLFLGFWLTMVAFIPIFLRVFSRERWRHIVLYCLIAGGCMYAIFSYSVNLSLFGGALESFW
jgi:hypothetical protein